MNFSERLKELRIQKGVTQKELANIIGVTPTSVQRFEYGTGKPALNTVIALAEYFDVSTDYLLGRTDIPNLHFVKTNYEILSKETLDDIIFNTRLDHRDNMKKILKEHDVPTIEESMWYTDALVKKVALTIAELLSKNGVSI